MAGRYQGGVVWTRDRGIQPKTERFMGTFSKSERDPMKIECTETVDVTFTADVTLEDVFSMWAQKISHDPTLRGVGPIIDWFTRMMDQIPPEIIAAFPEPAFNEVQRRLANLIDKFQAARALSLKSPDVQNRNGALPEVTPT